MKLNIMEPLKKLNYKNLIRNLICESRVLCKLFKGNKKYSHLLQELVRYKDDESLPLQKDILEILGLSRTQLMHLMEKLYQDFRERLFKPNAYPILNTEIWLFVKARDDYWPIGINNLSFIPRKGEDFTIEFIGELWDARYLIVESVIHEVENGIHKINIYLEKPALE